MLAREATATMGYAMCPPPSAIRRFVAPGAFPWDAMSAFSRGAFPWDAMGAFSRGAFPWDAMGAFSRDETKVLQVGPTRA